jgi:hypothetical protein
MSWDDLMVLSMNRSTRVMGHMSPSVIEGELLKAFTIVLGKHKRIKRVEMTTNQNNLLRFSELTSVLSRFFYEWDEEPLSPSLKDTLVKGLKFPDSKQRYPILGNLEDPDPVRSRLKDMVGATWKELKLVILSWAKECDETNTSTYNSGLNHLVKAKSIQEYQWEEKRKKRAEEERVNSQTKPGDTPRRPKACKLCGKEDHHATDYQGQKVTCTGYDPKTASAEQKKKAEETLAERKKGAAAYKGRPPGRKL